MPFARINGIDLYYETQGSGDPLLLIPGLGSDATTWAPFISSFEEYQTIIVENRGSGRSEKPAGPYSTGMMAEDAAALLVHLGIERTHIIGKSMGGMIAQWIAARWPEKVRSLVLASTVMHHDSYGGEMLELGRILAQKGGSFATYRLAFLLSYSREYCMKNRSRLEQMEALIAQVDSSELLRGYCEQSLACQQHDSRGIVSKIKAPALVIVGQDDMITPPGFSRELASAISGSELSILPKGGHGFWREFPDDVNAVVRDFLSRH
jgi:pimeloyl-ACP methyl ester carboxylesterase